MAAVLDTENPISKVEERKIATEQYETKQEKEVLASSALERDLNCLPDLEAIGDEYRRHAGNQINPYFFKIQKGGRISYLLGTEHDLPFSILHPTCQKIIEESACLVLEQNENSDDSVMSVDRSPKSEYEPNWYQALPLPLQTFLRHAFSLQKFTDDLIELEQLSFRDLATLIELEEVYFRQWGMETFMGKHFEKNKKPVYGLDKPAEEMLSEVFPGLAQIEVMSDEVERLIKRLKKLIILAEKESNPETLTAYNKDIKFYQELLEGYKDVLALRAKYCYTPMTEDIFRSNCESHWEGSLEYFSDSESEDQEFGLLGRRNFYWLPKILQLHQQVSGIPVIAVGEYHLVGRYGLLNLLKKSGFKIDRMNSNGMFEQYGDYDPLGSLAEMLALQERAYTTLRSQILGTQQIDWMSKFSTRIHKWEQRKKISQEKRLEAEREGYGPGALTIYNPDAAASSLGFLVPKKNKTDDPAQTQSRLKHQIRETAAPRSSTKKLLEQAGQMPQGEPILTHYKKAVMLNRDKRKPSTRGEGINPDTFKMK